MPQLFSVLFFLMLITLGMGSATGLITGIVTVVKDELPSLNETLVTAFICVAGFGVGIVYVTPGGQFIVELVLLLINFIKNKEKLSRPCVRL